MTNRDDKTRKAAILVAGLDRHTADALLDQMPPADAELVRRAAMSIETIDNAEQELVFQEFLGRQAAPRAAPSQHPGVELAGSLAQREPGAQREQEPGASATGVFAQPPVTNVPGSRSSDSPAPFRFLTQSEAAKLSPLLAEEHPQTIAVVASHLPPDQAARLMASLAPSLQAEVLRRLIDLEETHPDALRELEQGLQSRLEQGPSLPQRTRGIAAAASILGAAERSLERQLLNNLVCHAPDLAGRLSRYRFDFADLKLLDSAALAGLIRAADPRVVALALAGSELELVDRALRVLPPREARALEQVWRQFQPTSLADIEAAQHELVRLAEELDRANKIELPRRFRAPAA